MANSDGPAGSRADVATAGVARRLAAFLVDLVIVAAILGVAWFKGVAPHWLLVVTVFVGYHGALTWLNERTPGKAVFGLRVQRRGGGSYRLRPAGLLWTLGRAGLGYLVVDGFFVVGFVRAVRHRETGPTHDLVFRSTVVLVAEDLTSTSTTTWGLRHLERLEKFGVEHEATATRVRQRMVPSSFVRTFLTFVGRAAAVSFLLFELPSRLKPAWRWLEARLLSSGRRRAATAETPARRRTPARMAAGAVAANVLVWTVLIPDVGMVDDPPSTNRPIEAPNPPADTLSTTVTRPPAPPPSRPDRPTPTTSVAPTSTVPTTTLAPGRPPTLANMEAGMEGGTTVRYSFDFSENQGGRAQCQVLANGVPVWSGDCAPTVSGSFTGQPATFYSLTAVATNPHGEARSNEAMTRTAGPPRLTAFDVIDHSDEGHITMTWTNSWFESDDPRFQREDPIMCHFVIDGALREVRQCGVSSSMPFWDVPPGLHTFEAFTVNRFGMESNHAVLQRTIT